MLFIHLMDPQTKVISTVSYYNSCKLLSFYRHLCFFCPVKPADKKELTRIQARWELLQQKLMHYCYEPVIHLIVNNMHGYSKNSAESYISNILKSSRSLV